MALSQLICTELIRSGFQLVTVAECSDRTLRVPIDNWIEIGALLLLGRTAKPATLFDSDMNVLAWKGGAE
ncbi:MAG: hypothetical protein CFE26_11020, partial [Verrucomicrobiales bacterium VVV1]